MVTRIIYTEISPQLQKWLGESWQKILALGIGLILAGILVLVLPRLVAFLIALVFFFAAAVVIMAAYHLWQLSRTGQTTHIEID
ncbi:MAG: hypothetical protein JSW54_03530 [Fidelibacterota bacterium]|nr:MAG: hypothetical protein JSW54_03530 [Candidatus Neomarinimicrobiota bacterium]